MVARRAWCQGCYGVGQLGSTGRSLPGEASSARGSLHGGAQAQLQAAQAQQAVDAQQAAVAGGVVQGTPHDGGGPQPQGGESAANFTYRNRARRKACEKPSVRGTLCWHQCPSCLGPLWEVAAGLPTPEGLPA